uniref:hypothetical protein n=1 Tax=Phocaeicola plebeius TaxID=310297 RepID=UPI003079990F
STLSGINLQTDNYFQYTSLCLLHANEVKKTQVHLLSNAFAFQVKRKYVSGKTSKRFHTNVKAFFAPDELP